MPDAIFTSAVGPDSPSRRPAETVDPLHAVLELDRSAHSVHYDRSHLKPDVDGLMRGVVMRRGVVLVRREPSLIAVAALPDAPATPDAWPPERYDLIWILDRDGTGWRFTERGQALLAGDADMP